METKIQFNPHTGELSCQGQWNLTALSLLKKQLQAISWPIEGEIIFDGREISQMDSAGAWLLCKYINKLQQQGLDVRLDHFSKENKSLLSIVEKENLELTPSKIQKLNPLAKLGKYSLSSLEKWSDFLSFIGSLTLDFLRMLSRPFSFRWNSLAAVIDKTGYQALPIIALLSFMIGIVLVYQMGVQLRNYGANVFVVNLLGLSVLREFGPLITAIMVAGRTGSSYTAQLGIMKINQEIDALHTMGITPNELLLLPRIIGLAIALPLLTIWADIFGIIGGMFLANSMLDIGWYNFLQRFEQEIPLRALLIGLGKAPLFALIIASVGCFEGIRVKNNADSLGRNTTRSVVLGIFFIIILDAVISVILSKLKL